MVTLLEQAKDRRGHRGHARGRGQHRIGALETCEVILEQPLPGIPAAAVDVHRLPSAGDHLLVDLGVVLKARGHVNGRGDGPRGRVRGLVNGGAGQGPGVGVFAHGLS